MTVDAKFCPRCGSALPGPPPTRCTQCSYALYLNARPTATVIITRGGQSTPSDFEFLAVKRAIEPHRGKWELPGGFCDGWEHPTDAAVREAREELGVTVRLGDFIGMYVGGYEHQDETLPVLDCFWLASIAEGEIAPEPTEVMEYAWFPLADPPSLAFDTMNRALDDLRKAHSKKFV